MRWPYCFNKLPSFITHFIQPHIIIRIIRIYSGRCFFKLNVRKLEWVILLFKCQRLYFHLWPIITAWTSLHFMQALNGVENCCYCLWECFLTVNLKLLHILSIVSCYRLIATRILPSERLNSRKYSRACVRGFIALISQWQSKVHRLLLVLTLMLLTLIQVNIHLKTNTVRIRHHFSPGALCAV
jgi:hypothetical protein